MCWHFIVDIIVTVKKVKCVFSNEELAEFNDIEDDDYNSIDGPESIFRD